MNVSILDSAQIQLVVFGALRASTSAYLVYILRETPTDGSYTAIAAIKRENMKNETQENQVRLAN